MSKIYYIIHLLYKCVYYLIEDPCLHYCTTNGLCGYNLNDRQKSCPSEYIYKSNPKGKSNSLHIYNYLSEHLRGKGSTKKAHTATRRLLAHEGGQQKHVIHLLTVTLIFKGEKKIVLLRWSPTNKRKQAKRFIWFRMGQ